MDTESIDIKELKQISVRITCTHDNESKVGTGTIISDGKSYYVMTAAHCIEKDKKHPYELNEITLHTLFGGNEQKIVLKEIIEFMPEENKDYALLLIEKPTLTFDYVNNIKRLSESYGNSAELFGYIKPKPDGRLFKLSIADENVWSVANVTEKGLNADEALSGMSGASLCIKKNGIIFCIGYVKGTQDKLCSFDDIRIYPMTNFSHLPSNTLVESLLTPAVPMAQGQKGNESKIKYGQLWANLDTNIWSEKNYHSLLEKIKEAKALYPNTKSVHAQKQVIASILGKTEIWNDDECKAFALAMYDCGLIPILYEETIQNQRNLEPIKEWQHLLQRQISLMGEMPEGNMAPSDYTDDEIYEHIMRAAFCLDFIKMHELLLTWSPSGMWIAKRALLMNLYQSQEAESAHKVLETYIETGNLCLEDKFIAINIYNIIDKNIKKKYDYTEFWKAGIDSVSEVLNYISNQINYKKDQIKLYGIHYTTIIGGNEEIPFLESLRFLQYIINTGITTNFRYTYFVEKERWFKVYKMLFRFLPYPCLYYTLQYNDEKLIRRAAQEMAYTDDENFLNVLPEILCRLLDTVKCKSTPIYLFPSNYNFAQELYIAVKEEIWYDKFRNTILSLFCEDIQLENVSESDAIFKNVYAAIKSLQAAKRRSDIFIQLIDTLPKNPHLINILICNALKIDSSMLNANVIIALNQTITKFELKDVYKILYKFQNKGFLSSDQLQQIATKYKVEDMSFAKDDNISVIMLSYLVRSTRAIETLKTYVLVKNIWDCGITPNYFTDPNPWRINMLSDLVEWKKNEWAYIKKNMIDNLMLIKEQHSKRGQYDAFNGNYLSLIYDMHQFLIIQNKKFKRNIDEVMSLLKEVYSLKFGYKNFEDAISADEYEKVSQAIMFLNLNIHSEGIINYLPQVRIVIMRVFLKKQTCLSLCLSLVESWTREYHDIMIANFGDELHQILRNFCAYDYESLDLSVPYTNKKLRLLAESLETKYGTKLAIQYWLNDPLPNRFNL